MPWMNFKNTLLNQRHEKCPKHILHVHALLEEARLIDGDQCPDRSHLQGGLNDGWKGTSWIEASVLYMSVRVEVTQMYMNVNTY